MTARAMVSRRLSSEWTMYFYGLGWSIPSAFINDQSLNQKQIAFVKKIINHIELNGYMENVSELTKPPFDKPVSFIKLFDAKTRTALIATINQIRENAVQIVAS